MIEVVRLSMPLEEAATKTLAALHGACFPTPWSAEEIASLAAMPGAFAALADTSAGPIGFVLGRCAADEAEIITIGVMPSERRHGTGRALLAAAHTQAAERGARTLFIEVATGNTPAIALYRSAAFAEVGRRPAYYASGQDAIVMRLALSTATDENSVNP